jgi:hypothetical protein
MAYRHKPIATIPEKVPFIGGGNIVIPGVYQTNPETGKIDEYGQTFKTGKSINGITYQRTKYKKDKDGNITQKTKYLKIDDFKKGDLNADGTKFETTLLPAEITKAHRLARRDYQKFAQTFKDIKPSRGAKTMVLDAFRQLEIINTATAKAQSNYRARLANVFAGLDGPSQIPVEIDPIEYTDLNGNECEMKLAVNKDSFGRKQYFEQKRIEEPKLDRNGNPQKDSNGNPIMESSLAWVQIQEREFYDDIGMAYRCRIKAERGMTHSLFELSDKEGNKLIITDARDDSEKENSYNDNSAPLNFFQRDRSGSTQQLSGKELATVIETSGMSLAEIKIRHFNGVMAKVGAKVGEALGREALHIVGRQISDNLSHPIEFR